MKNYKNNHILSRAFFYIFLVIFIFIVFYFSLNSSYYINFNQYNILLAFSTFIPLLIGVFSLAQYFATKDDQLLVLGSGFIIVFFLEIIHFLIYGDPNSNIRQVALGSPSQWTNVFSSLFLPLMVIYGWWVWHREHRFNKKGLFAPPKIIISITSIGVILWLTLIVFPIFQLSFYRYSDGNYLHLINAFLIFISIILIFIKKEWANLSLDKWILAGLIMMFFAQILFFSNSLVQFDALFSAGYTIKIVSYMMFMIGLIINMHQTIKSAEENRQILEKENIELRNTRETSIVLKIMAEKNKRNIEKALEETQKSKKELEQMNEIMVDRELKMMELKSEITKLKKAQGLK
ncbi:hypothetical protein DYH10_00725 [Candidatus Saccharibacteria bacterium CPR2]|nr:hypothetical protein [Candidatus Saccharibacteria bacterium CPR2]